jgi:4-carboxymuconolactone decarboxylase
MARKLSEYFSIDEHPGFSETVERVFTDTDLSPRYRRLTAMAACQALNATGLLKGFIAWGFDSGIDYCEIYEVLLQGHLFCGYPRAIESFFCFTEVAGNLNRIPPKTGGEDPKNIELFASRGRQLAERIYGKNLDLVLRNIRSHTPELAAGMINEGYGRIISRDGLDIIARELAIVAILTVSNMPRQLYSHIRGAANVGASRKQIKATIEQCRLFVSDEIIAGCLSIFEKSLGN